MRKLAKALYLNIEEVTGQAHFYIMGVLLAGFLSTALMLVFNLMQWYWLNAIIFILLTFFGIAFAMKPRGAAILAGAGFAVEGLRDRDMSQGVVQGPVWLFKAIIALAWGFWIGTWVLLIIPFNYSPGSYYVFLATLLGFVYAWVTFSSETKWPYRISVAMLVAGVVHSLLMVYPPYSQKWGDILRERDQTQAAQVTVRSENVVSARSAGATIAPVGGWSEWREFRDAGMCFRVWTANLDADDIKVRYLDRDDGDPYMYQGGYIANAAAIGFQSKTGTPTRVNYQVWDKVPGQRCEKK